MASPALIAVILAGMILASEALAVPAGKTLDWDTANGKVTFDGKVHAEKGIKCPECHTNIFKMKKDTSAMKMDDLNAGKFCGVCHNGTKSFKTADPDNCVRCHKK